MKSNLDIHKTTKKDGVNKEVLSLETYSMDEFNKKFNLNIEEDSSLDNFINKINSSGTLQCSSAGENKDASIPTPVYVDSSSKESYKHLQVNNFVTVVKVK